MSTVVKDAFGTELEVEPSTPPGPRDLIDINRRQSVSSRERGTGADYFDRLTAEDAITLGNALVSAGAEAIASRP